MLCKCFARRGHSDFSASPFELVEYQEPQHEEEKVCKRLTSPEYMNCVGSTSRSSLACLRRTCDASTSSESGEVSGIRSTLQFPDLQEKDVQGSANPRGPGSENKRTKSYFLLPAAGRRTQIYPVFIRTWALWISLSLYFIAHSTELPLKSWMRHTNSFT